MALDSNSAERAQFLSTYMLSMLNTPDSVHIGLRGSAVKITFVLHRVDLSGGVKVVFEYANHLHERGHDVSVVYPKPKFGGFRLKLVRQLVGENFRPVGLTVAKISNSSWFDLHARLVAVDSLDQQDSIPDGDVVIATWWETTFPVSRYPKSKGTKFYLVQHHETWAGPMDKVDMTYKIGLNNIVVSSWLEQILRGLGAEIAAKILNGVDFQEFYPEPVSRKTDELRILMPYRSLGWKAAIDGVRAFKIVRDTYNNAKLVMFGTQKLRSTDEVEYHHKPKTNQLRFLYNSCDIFMFPSHAEGFGLPPMEAMACRVPVVSTNVGAIPDCSIPGKTALVSPPMHPELLAENLIELIRDAKKRKDIAEMGYQHIQRFTWDKATDELEHVFRDYSAR